VVCDVPLALTAVLPTNQYIDETLVNCPSVVNPSCDSGVNVLLGASVCFDDQIRKVGKTLDFPLGAIPSNVFVVRNVIEFRISLPKTIAEDLVRRRKVDVKNRITKRLPKRLDLLVDAHGIDNNDRRRRLSRGVGEPCR
jgi:hypothetical protein